MIVSLGKWTALLCATTPAAGAAAAAWADDDEDAMNPLNCCRPSVGGALQCNLISTNSDDVGVDFAVDGPSNRDCFACTAE